MALIVATEEKAISGGSTGSLYSVFRLILQVLFESELLSEACLMAWISQRESDDKCLPRKELFLQPHVQAFVEWLQEDEDNDDDDDEDDEVILILKGQTLAH